MWEVLEEASMPHYVCAHTQTRTDEFIDQIRIVVKKYQLKRSEFQLVVAGVDIERVPVAELVAVRRFSFMAGGEKVCEVIQFGEHENHGAQQE